MCNLLDHPNVRENVVTSYVRDGYSPEDAVQEFRRWQERMRVSAADLRYARAVLHGTTSGDSTGSQDDQRLIETNNGRQP